MNSLKGGGAGKLCEALFREGGLQLFITPHQKKVKIKGMFPAGGNDIKKR